MSFGSENSRETGWSDKELVHITNMLEKLKLPGEEEEREMYALVRDTLKDAGYRQYEISNFSLPGYESRHNTSYWKRTPYLGFGLGASSFVNDRRLKNTMVLQEYLRTGEKRDSFAENLLVSRKEAMEETMFLGLRMTEGVSRTAFQKDFGTELEAVYGKEISKLISEKLIEEEGDFLRLTERGVDYGNYVFSRFFL